MDLQSIGRFMLVGGIVVAVIGLILMFAGQMPFLKDLSRFDIRVQNENFTCIVPVAGMILLSIILTVVLNIIVRIINRP